MANTWIEPPPPQKGMGCFGKGCIILLVFGFVLATACAIGLYWGFRHNSAVMHGAYLMTQTHLVGSAPKPVPTYEAQPGAAQAVREKWENFKTTAQQQGPAEIEFTADDLNSLISRNRRLRGNVSVSIEGNRLHVQSSVPLQEYARQKGYYLNADIIVEFNGPQSVDNPPVNAIVVNGRALSAEMLDWSYKSQSLRQYLQKARIDESIGTIEIRDGKIVLRSRSD